MSPRRTGQPGAAAPEARRGRGRPKGGPRVRPDSRSGEYLILGFDGVIRTGLWDKEAAELRLAEERLKRANPALVRPDMSVPLRTVIEHGMETARTGAVPHLLDFWADVPLDQLTRAACWAYEDFRREQSGGRSGRDGPATGTIKNELANLGTMVRGYCADHGIDPAPKVFLPDDELSVRRFLRLREVNRLILAAEGQIWDADSGDWRRSERSGAPILRDPAARTRMLPMARLVRLLIWTGSRVDSVLRATWSRRRDRGWVDLRVGMLYRKGAAERSTGKGRPPVRLVEHLLGKIETWAAEDKAAGFDDVIHDDRGGRIGVARAWTLFVELRAAAGLDETVTPRTLRSSCAIWLMEAGLTVEEAAEFLGNTPGVLAAFYDHFAAEFSHVAADALDSRRYK